MQTGQHPRVSTDAKHVRHHVGWAWPAQRRHPPTWTSTAGRSRVLFLQVFNSWYDPEADKARPIAALIDQFATGDRATRTDVAGPLTGAEQASVIDGFRLAYLSEARPTGARAGRGCWPTRR